MQTGRSIEWVRESEKKGEGEWERESERVREWERRRVNQSPTYGAFINIDSLRMTQSNEKIFTPSLCNLNSFFLYYSALNNRRINHFVVVWFRFSTFLHHMCTECFMHAKWIFCVFSKRNTLVYTVNVMFYFHSFENFNWNVPKQCHKHLQVN